MGRRMSSSQSHQPPTDTRVLNQTGAVKRTVMDSQHRQDIPQYYSRILPVHSNHAETDIIDNLTVLESSSTTPAMAALCLRHGYTKKHQLDGTISETETWKRPQGIRLSDFYFSAPPQPTPRSVATSIRA